jgi:hypothetical protein
MLKISGKLGSPKLETQETKILRRLTNMGFDEEQRQIILAKAIVHPEQKYMLRCSKETFFDMLSNLN